MRAKESLDLPNPALNGERIIDPRKALHVIVSPVIWSCLAAAAFLDIVVTVYQKVCFPVYRIPQARRSDYITHSRNRLKYLSGIEKLNCLYCSYFNGVMAYASEVAARTEQYWCPIKHAKKIKNPHSRYEKFFAYGDESSYKKDLDTVRSDFSDLKKETGDA